MAREIIIYEQNPDGVRCMFVYPTRFDRAGEMFAYTPSAFLEDSLKVLLTTEELAKLDRGELSYQLVIFRIPEGSSEMQRDNLLFDKYRAYQREFETVEVFPKQPAPEYLDLPGRP